MVGEYSYSTLSVKVALKYAQQFEHEGKSYKIVFNQVCPDSLTVINTETTGVGEYWVQPRQLGSHSTIWNICIKDLSVSSESSSGCLVM
jgi:hypothetical protein